jgi:hypothetical protein
MPFTPRAASLIFIRIATFSSAGTSNGSRSIELFQVVFTASTGTSSIFLRVINEFAFAIAAASVVIRTTSSSVMIGLAAKPQVPFISTADSETEILTARNVQVPDARAC